MPPPEGGGAPGWTRSRSCGLPRSLHDLSLSPGGSPRSSASIPAVADRLIGWLGLLQLGSPPELSLRAGCSPPLVGFVLFCPSTDSHTGCPLPGARGLPSAGQCHLPDPVPPTRFLTALTASSTRVSRACCIPQPVMGFAVLPTRPASLGPKAPLHGPRLSHDAIHTLRRTPLASSRTASPRPLPSCRFHSLRAASHRLSPERPPHRSGACVLPGQASLARVRARSGLHPGTPPHPDAEAPGLLAPSRSPAEAGSRSGDAHSVATTSAWWEQAPLASGLRGAPECRAPERALALPLQRE